MRQFKITVNGKAYQVDVEELTKSGSLAPSTSAQAPKAPIAPKTPATKAPAPPITVAGGNTVKAPMPGTILDVKIKPGDRVESGDVLIILEAMKMENEIMAPQAGTIESVQVKQNDSVNSGEVLVVLN